jgi:hypothetical protein
MGLLFLIFLTLLHRFLKENQFSAAAAWAVLMLCVTALGLYDFATKGACFYHWPGGWSSVSSDSAHPRRSVVAAECAERAGISLSSGCCSAASLSDGAIVPSAIPLFAGKYLPGLRDGLLLFGPLSLRLWPFTFSIQWLYSSPFTVSSYIKFGWPGAFATRWLWTAGISLKARFFFCLISAAVAEIWLRRRRTGAGHFFFCACFLSLRVYVLLYLLILVFWGLGEISSGILFYP